MIVKEMDSKNCTSPQSSAGQRQEKDVAFFLRRAFKDTPLIYVFNDFKFTYNDEAAQIDHLILYRFGFVLIESKSITGSVKVNKQEEWSRSYRGKWQGMPSPIKQVEMQARLLKDLLHENRSQLVGTLLGIQQTLGNRCWDHLCAVSSNAMVEREHMPKIISEKLVKSEFLVDTITKIMDFKNVLLRMMDVRDARPAFNDDEVDAIRDFLISQCKSMPPRKSVVNEKSTALKVSPKTKPTLTTLDDVFHPPKHIESDIIASNSWACKNCQEQTRLTPLSGKYGYFVKCDVCKVNTPLKKPCKSCDSKKTKVSKKGGTYTLKCSSCTHEEHLLTIA